MVMLLLLAIQLLLVLKICDGLCPVLRLLTIVLLLLRFRGLWNGSLALTIHDSGSLGVGFLLQTFPKGL